MPDGYNREPNNEAAFSFDGLQKPTSLQDIQRDLARAWCLTLASQIGQALTVLEAIERQLDNLSPRVATRYRLEGSAGLAAHLTQTHSRAAKVEYVVPRSADGSGRATVESDSITIREHDVLSMISQGRSNKHIARTLKISPETVKSHVKRIFSKLSVNTRTEAVSRAISLRLL